VGRLGVPGRRGAGGEHRVFWPEGGVGAGAFEAVEIILQPARLGRLVVIHEGDVARLGCGQARVAGSRDVARGCWDVSQRDCRTAAQGFHQWSRQLVRVVVAHQDLPADALGHALLETGEQGALQQSHPVVAGDENTDLGGHRAIIVPLC